MKKIISALLLLAMCLALTACGGDDGVHDALQGSWVAKWSASGKSLSRYYTFKGDQYTTGGVAIFGELDTKTGTFEIKEDTIHLIPDDGSDATELDYSYSKDSGTLILWWTDDVQFERGTVSVSY